MQLLYTLKTLLFYASLTFLLELPITFIFLNPKKYKNVIKNCLLINFITNLSLNLILLFYRTNIIIYILEIIIIIIEYLMWKSKYKNINKKLLNMTIFSNIFSYLIGLIVF